jgi:hypothetical protein
MEKQSRVFYVLWSAGEFSLFGKPKIPDSDTPLISCWSDYFPQTQEIQEMDPGASVLLLYMYLRSERSNAAKYVTEVSMSRNYLTVESYKKG